MQRFQKPQRGKGDVFARLAGNSFNFGEMPEVRPQEKRTSLLDVLATGAKSFGGGLGMGPEKNPDYHGTPPFVYDPEHPYYKQGGDLYSRLQDEGDVRQHIEGGDRYGRRQGKGGGFPVRPQNVADTDYVLNEDGTPTKYQWRDIDELYNEPSRQGKTYDAQTGQEITSMAGAALDGAFAQRRRGGDYESERDAYVDALDAPIKKKSGWKDALYKIATVASNMFNPDQQLPVVGLGRAQYNQNVDRAGQRFARFQALEDKDLTRQQKRTDIWKKRGDAQRDAQSLANTQFNQTFTNLTKDDELSEEDVAALTPMATAAGVAPPTKGNWRSYQIDYDADGNQIRIPKTGTGNPEKTGIAKPKEGTAYFDGLPMKPSEAGDLKVRREEFNARGAFDANKENANNELEAAKANATNTLNYQKELFNRIQAVGDASKKSADVLKDVDALMVKAQDAFNDGDYAASENFSKQAEARAKHAGSFSDVINQMNAAKIKRPDRIVPRKIEPRSVGKPVSKAKDPHGYFR